MNYFGKFKSIQELKDQFRKQCMIHHPDIGGDANQFKKMYNEYRELLENALNGKFKDDPEKVKNEMNIDQQMRDVIDKIIHLNQIKLEIIGNWLWVSGKTYEVKDKLKEAGLIFAGKKQAWYWKSYKYHKKSKKKYTLEDLRSMFDSEELENKKMQQLS